MKHRSAQGQQEAKLQEQKRLAKIAYDRAATISEKHTALDEIKACDVELEKLSKQVHQYKCLHCKKKYSAKSAHLHVYLESVTTHDKSGRPILHTFGHNKPKLGWCDGCAVEVMRDIESE